MIRLAQSLLAKLRTDRLSRDIAFSLGSFAVLAASGIVINIAVAGLRGADALGIFNQSYAVYIVASQFAVFGLHYSVLRHGALYENDAIERGRMLGTACFLAVGSGFAWGMLTFAVAPALGSAFASEETGAAIRNAAFGLALFPLNKVLLGYLNSLRLMRAHAILQALRYATLAVLVIAATASTLPERYATFGFLGAELLTTLGAVVYLRRRALSGAMEVTRGWIDRHLRYGGKGLLAGMFAEVNSRVDVLMIGLLLSDRAVGIYSFAAMLVDGVYHVFAMVRLNFNPILVSSVRDGDRARLSELLAKTKKILVPTAITLALLVVFTLWFLAEVVVSDPSMLEGLPSLLILLVGLTVIAPFVPFDNAMLVIGHPGYQTIQQMATVCVNALGAALLLPVLGIEGAAAGTALGYLTGVAVLLWFAKRTMHWNLVTNTWKD